MKRLKSKLTFSLPLLALAFLFAGVNAFADMDGVIVPENQGGQEASAQYAGFEGGLITTAVGVGVLISSGDCVVAGVVISTPGIASCVTLYSTDVVSGITSSQMKVPQLCFVAASTSYTATTNAIWLTPPVRHRQGIVALADAGAANTMSIIYLKRE